jgi:hypothetical protein
VQDVEPISDEELTALAMAADPDAPIAVDAVPFGSADDDTVALLPSWYMPAPGRRPDRGRRLVFAGVVCSLLIGNVAGFCVTNGFPEFVW